MMFKQPLPMLAGGILALALAMGIGRFAYTPILPLMQKELSFSDGAAGLLAASNYGGYFLGAILAGRLPVEGRRTAYLRVSLLAGIAATAGMAIFAAPFSWHVLRFLSGMASAFAFVLASSLVLDELAVRGRTSWSGILYGGVGIGMVLSSVAIPSLDQVYDWRGIWMGLAAVSLVLWVFIWLWIKEAPPRQAAGEKAVKKRPLPPVKWLPWLTAAYGLEGLGYIVTGTFIVAIADQEASRSIPAAYVWLAAGLAAIPSCIFWSAFARRFGYVKTLISAMLLQALGIIMPVWWHGSPGIWISSTLFGATFMGITTLAATLAREIQPRDSSRILGKLTAYYAAGQMAGPLAAGVMAARTHNFDAALAGASGIVFLGALLLVKGIGCETQ
ncbi:YbfB/YjiJ family MFS transporter [Peribacillus sp. SCS-37]|uniref:YbfB/YjiJ family MFS transporter n=1 Tax=Paraperibacillus esterisolvens TaxID=3115296 RepID=UPI003906016C